MSDEKLFVLIHYDWINPPHVIYVGFSKEEAFDCIFKRGRKDWILEHMWISFGGEMEQLLFSANELLGGPQKPIP